ncbi:hypothetical protein DFP72DRAFT_843186 [Ephemerocybe angulata]|uniref:Uncharacterized protein n=1 Tax=Ephemerocybe angulata TaxID=980116 RepID=A0A8H6MED8_9AGAR|nr:hypothetical protein DFP72DRAFT_843186 [Tulosesus angulatus]
MDGWVRTEDDDGHVDAAQHAELVRLFEQPVLALQVAIVAQQKERKPRRECYYTYLEERHRAVAFVLHIERGRSATGGISGVGPGGHVGWCWCWKPSSLRAVAVYLYSRRQRQTEYVVEIWRNGVMYTQPIADAARSSRIPIRLSPSPPPAPVRLAFRQRRRSANNQLSSRVAVTAEPLAGGARIGFVQDLCVEKMGSSEMQIEIRFDGWHAERGRDPQQLFTTFIRAITSIANISSILRIEDRGYISRIEKKGVDRITVPYRHLSTIPKQRRINAAALQALPPRRSEARSQHHSHSIHPSLLPTFLRVSTNLRYLCRYFAPQSTAICLLRTPLPQKDSPIMYVYVRNNVIAQKPTSDPNIQNALGGINAFLVFDAFCLLKMERTVSADISRPHLVHPIHPSIFLFSSCFPLLREFDWSHRPGSFINPRITHAHGRRITGITAQAERKAIFPSHIAHCQHTTFHLSATACKVLGRRWRRHFGLKGNRDGKSSTGCLVIGEALVGVFGWMEELRRL